MALAALWGAALWLPLGACGNPCRELSDTVCRCAQTAEEEARCLRQVRALAGQDRSADAASQQICASLLDTCTCAALAAGDLAACGLATQGR